MLGTLMRYEFKAVGRLLLPLYGAWLIAAVMLGLSLGSNGTDEGSPLLIALSGILYGGACITAIVITIILLIQRFYKNLLGNEGYLMFALPVSTGKHLINKTVCGAVWSIAGVFVGILTAFAIVISIEGFGSFFDEIKFVIGDILIMMNREPSSILLILEFLILACAAAVEFVVKIYAAIAVGHQWDNHRVLGAILAYIGFGIIESIIGNLFSILCGSGTGNVVIDITSEMPYMLQMHLTMLAVFLAVCAIAAVYWFICWKLLDKKLNLE